MNAWSLGSNVALLLTSLAMGLLVAFKGRRHRAAPLFLGLCITAVLFSATRLLVEFRPVPAEKLFWTRIGYLCAFALLPIFLEFPDAMLGTKAATARLRRFVWSICAVFSVLDFTPWMLDVGKDGTIGHGGPGLFAVWIVFSAVNLRFLYLFWRARVATADEALKNRIDYLLTGVFVFGVAAGLDIARRLELFVVFPCLVAQWGVLFFMIVSGFAIARHKLLDIEVVFSRGLVYSGTTFGVASFFIAFSELVATLGERKLAPIHPANAGFIAGILSGFTFEPVRHLIQIVVDRLFFFRDRDALERVQRFRRLHTMVLERDKPGLESLREQLDAIISDCDGERKP